LGGEIPGEEVWRDLKVHLQLGVTKGTLNEMPTPREHALSAGSEVFRA
jgi:hypothetical protein